MGIIQEQVFSLDCLMLFNDIDFLSVLNWLSLSLVLMCQLIFGIIYFQVKNHYQYKKQKRYFKLLDHYFCFFLTKNTKRKIKIDDKSFYLFISFWSSKFNSVDPCSKKRLTEMADLLKINKICIKKLNSTKRIYSNINTKKICLIIHTLGNFYYGNKSSNFINLEIENFIKHKLDIISFEACICLLKINNQYYCPIVLQEILVRENWSNRELKYLMHFFNTHESMLMILKLIENCNKDNEKRIMEIASRTDFFKNFVNYILKNINKFSIDTICLAIRNINDPDDFELINHLKEESNWVYQVNIIQAIMRLNYFSQNNFDYLLKSLSSPNWWIRKRSAQAIIQYYGSDVDLIDSLIERIDDKFAKDALIVESNKYEINNFIELV